MNKSIVSFRTLSMWAYFLDFGALFGYATFGYTIKLSDGSDDTMMLFVWAIMALVGSILIGLKNRQIANGPQRMRVSLTDVAVLAAAFVLISVLPDFIGMLKGLVLLVLFTAYLWYFKTLEIQAGLTPSGAR